MKILIQSLVIGVIIMAELAISFYMPLLPVIRQSFNAGEQMIQLTMSMNVLGIGISAIIYGSISDVLGRRYVMLTGITIFSLASLLCAMTDSIVIFIMARLMQGLGSGVAWTVGNATMRDVFYGQQFAKAIILVHVIVGMAPIVAPIFGGYLGEIIGWRNCFIVLFIISLSVLIVCMLTLPETIATKSKFNMKQIKDNYKSLFAAPQFWRYLAVKVLIVSALFVDITNLPLVFIENLNVPMVNYGYYAAIGAISYVIGGLVSNKLVRWLSADHLIYIGLSSILLSSIIFYIADNLTQLSAIQIQLIKIPTSIGFAFVFGNATYCIINAVPKSSGSASAFMITTEMLVSSLGIDLVSLYYNGTIVPAVTYISGCTIISFCLLKGIHVMEKQEVI